MAFLDLGLSVLWADHNLGAEEFGEYGEFYTLEEAQHIIKEQSIEGRIPTETEWNELINKCSWSFSGICSKRDGLISGYSIKGNGQSIFIPAAGLYSDKDITVRRDRVYHYGSNTFNGNSIVAPLSQYVEPSLGMRVQQLNKLAAPSDRLSFILVKDKSTINL